MLSNLFSRRRTSEANRKPFRPGLEALETRLAPATVYWSNPASGDWFDANNWTDATTLEHRLPGPDDDARIERFEDITVTYDGNTTVKTLTTGNHLEMTGGTLTVRNPERETSFAVNLEVGSGATLEVENGTFGTDGSRRRPTLIVRGTLHVAGGATFQMGGCGGYSPDITYLEGEAWLAGEGQYVAQECGAVEVNSPRVTLAPNLRVAGPLVANADTFAGRNFILEPVFRVRQKGVSLITIVTA